MTRLKLWITKPLNLGLAFCSGKIRGIETKMSTPVLLVIGAGPNVGAAIAKKFASKGYKVALAARSFSEGIQPDGYFHVKADLSNPENVPRIFREVRKTHGTPNIVVYNGLASLWFFLPKNPV